MSEVVSKGSKCFKTDNVNRVLLALTSYRIRLVPHNARSAHLILWQSVPEVMYCIQCLGIGGVQRAQTILWSVESKRPACKSFLIINYIIIEARMETVTV